MSFDRDDPRLTAYVVGEVDERERLEIEQALAADPAATAEVEALRALADSLASELAGEQATGLTEAPVLTESQRAAVLRTPPRRPARIWFELAAACVLVGLVGWVAALLLAEETVVVREFSSAESALLPGSSRDKPEALGLDILAGRGVAGSGSGGQAANGKETHRFGDDGEEGYGSPDATAQAGLQGPAPTPVPAAAPAPAEVALGDAFETGDAFEKAASSAQPASMRGAGSAGGAREVLRLHKEQLAQRNKPAAPGPALSPRVVTTNPSDGATVGAISGATSPGVGRTPQGESYHLPPIQGFRVARREHTSTFSVDVDTASYSNVRRILNSGWLPAWSAVRIEEMVNYFRYGYAGPAGDAPQEGEQPFAVHTQVAQCPWNPDHRLARIALQGRRIAKDKRPLSNLVFLVDVSGSMESEDKLPLLKSGLEMLTEQLGVGDRVAIVTYSGSAGIALESTAGTNKDAILSGIRALKAGGSTNGASGIQMAYAVAAQAFLKKGVNRVILCTDGDFNVGVTSNKALVGLIQEKARTGVFLSVLGFGTGNYKDAKMEALSNRGNGNYAYIDSLKEARRVLVEEMSGTLVTIAKDVKVQVFFNPAKVSGYRLLGYENRRLAARDFNDDTKDAGEIGAGHSVTALYEIVPTGKSLPGAVDPNPYVQPKPSKPTPEVKGDGLFTLRLRWKAPHGEVSRLLEREVRDDGQKIGQADKDFQWASAVAGFGMVLRNSPYKGSANYGLVLEIAQAAKGEDAHGRRAEFLDLVEKASALSKRK